MESPGDTIALLKRHLKPARGERAKQFARWIADLEDEEFEDDDVDAEEDTIGRDGKTPL